jgi:putative addiction module killer protein
MSWVLEYWCDDNNKNSLEHWFDQLTDEQFKSIAKELKLLEMSGNELRLPHSRSLGSGLFELRERRYGYRVYYTFCKNKIILLLGAGDKTSQRADIKLAQRRLLELRQERGGI